LAQTNEVVDNLKILYPDLEVEIRPIKTTGDIIRDSPKRSFSQKGIFVKEIEEALLKGKIDLAIHSMKDVPTSIPKGLTICAVTKRSDFQDALISKKGQKLDELPYGAKVGTSSLRRKAQLICYREDLQVVDLRGNLDTRLKKLYKKDFDSIVVASCGLKRLGLEGKITQLLEKEFFLPAAGQGTLALQTRKDDRIVEKISILNHEDSRLAVSAERAFLEELGGGCHVPIGVLGLVNGKDLILTGMIVSIKERFILKERLEGLKSNPRNLGIKLAKVLKSKGADKILEEYN
jgi:hydroxymethylbilane synthase